MPAATNRAFSRALASWEPIALAAVAAALAWWITHSLLGHPQPFFAPIAAAIALSTSRIQRSRRTVQLVSGVLLGIGVGEALAATLGTSTAALGLIVFVTLMAARLSGAGFFGEGMMFANQAAASAILVVTLHRHGTGGERIIDAAVGGAVALVLGVGLFPAEPLSLLADAERSVLRTLAETLTKVSQLLAAGERPEDDWAVRASHDIHRQLAMLAQARATARANVRVAPRRWRLRDAVAAEIRRTAQLDLLANAVLGLVRAAATDIHGDGPLSEPTTRQVAAVADAIGRLARAPQPWPLELVQFARNVVVNNSQRVGPSPVGREEIVASVLRAAVADLSEVIDVPNEEESKRNGRPSDRVGAITRRS
jgi:uncharacterized membrane protein YgaE (UPF0421/DUF939 family)